MWLDKLIIALVSPLGTALVLGLLALLLGALRWRRAAWGLGLLGLAWLWLWATPVASHALRGALEAPYPPGAPGDLHQPHAHAQAQALVLLGGGVRPAEVPGRPPNLNAAADRVWHAARLYHAGVAPLVVASGGSDPATSASSEARAMAQLLRDLGVPAHAIRLEGRSRNTRQNAQYTAQLLRPLGVRRVVLVTSALHMPRAVALFEAQGFEVLPAATDHEARQRFSAMDWLPEADALDGSGRAMKEWVGRLSGR